MFQNDLEAGNIRHFHAQAGFAPQRDLSDWKEFIDGASVYLIQHSWADAFRSARDYIGGEIRLPDDACAFEFRINDRHVIAFATDVEGALHTQMAVQVKKGWVLFPRALESDPKFGRVAGLIADQVRAVAVALDAEIATVEATRVPLRPAGRRRPTDLPAVSYHVVNLARRGTRVEPLARNDAEPLRHIRLHFRRGHWRHFESFKTWIRWCLVGDPSTGFVDKEYRL